MNVDEFLKNEVNRRRFLENSARNAAGVAAGLVTLGNSASASTAASERLRIGVVGVRSQGLELASLAAAMPDVEIATLCDVDQSVLQRAASRLSEVLPSPPRCESDFRRVLDDPSIDAVVIATPDHWHAAMAIEACRAEKDVYVETPVAHTIDEGARVLQSARETGRIVQCGLQQRSGEHFRAAVDLVRGGEIGTVQFARAWVSHRRKPIGFKSDGQPPSDLDYDAWLGPAPGRGYQPNRCHHNWQWFWDYGSGELGVWGVHLLDVARWGLGVELPTRVSANGGKHYLQDDRETPDTLSVQFCYPMAGIVWEHRQWTSHGIEGRSAAVAFYGDRGTLIVDRGGWKIYGRRDNLTSDATELQPAHLRDFVDAVKTRSTPTADIEIGHVSSTLCHLGNIAYRLNREIVFDPGKVDFGSDSKPMHSSPVIIDHHGGFIAELLESGHFALFRLPQEREFRGSVNSIDETRRNRVHGSGAKHRHRMGNAGLNQCRTRARQEPQWPGMVSTVIDHRAGRHLRARRLLHKAPRAALKIKRSCNCPLTLSPCPSPQHPHARLHHHRSRSQRPRLR